MPTRYDGVTGMYQSLPGLATEEGETLLESKGSVLECQTLCDNTVGCGSFSYCAGSCSLKTAVLSADASYMVHDTCSTYIRTDSDVVIDSPCSMRKALPPAPYKATDLNGVAWPELCYRGKAEEHIFLIGDWGGLPPSWGSHEPRPADNVKSKQHPRKFFQGTDDHAQQYVANHLNERAKWKNPRYVLNVGDNFYWGGLGQMPGQPIQRCGRPSNSFSLNKDHQFGPIYENVYKGPGIDGKPWMSVLGNHDYGGFLFTSAWDQQIAYTWEKSSGRWYMPAQFWSQHVRYPDQNFTVDILLLDNNYLDAKHPDADSEHNICGYAHNYRGSKCGLTGPWSVESCPSWFHKLFHEQTLPWFEKQMDQSTADWQIVVSHFPPEDWYDGKRWRELTAKYGIDLWVAGHRHTQEVWYPSHLGDTAVVVTGGGGGVTSEGWPNHWSPDYGYMDVTISKTELKIEAFRMEWANDWTNTTTIVKPRQRGRTTACDWVLGKYTWRGQTCLQHIVWMMQHKAMSEDDAKVAVGKEYPRPCGACAETTHATAALADLATVMDYYNTSRAEDAQKVTDPGSGDGMGEAGLEE